MTIPYRGTTGDGTYFVTSSTFQKKSLLQSVRTATLFIETLLEYRSQHKYLLHEFVVMPDHFANNSGRHLGKDNSTHKGRIFIPCWKVISGSRKYLAAKFL